eukprot:117440_1
MANQTPTVDDESIEEEIPFSTSVYSYFYSSQSSLCEKMSAMIILLFQIALFGLLILAVQDMERTDYDENNNKLIPLKIKEHGMDGCEADQSGYWSFTINDILNYTLSNQYNNYLPKKTFYCTRYTDGSLFYIPGIPIVAAFLFTDVIMAIYNFKINFCASIAILFECFAALVCGIICMTASTDNPLTTILGGVAVMFVHDIDESMKKGVDTIHIECMKCFGPILCWGIGVALLLAFHFIIL